MGSTPLGQHTHVHTAPLWPQVVQPAYGRHTHAAEHTCVHMRTHAHTRAPPQVVFLQPRPQPAKAPKTPAAAAAAAASMPSRCVLDGRQLMDVGSRYCSIRCVLSKARSSAVGGYREVEALGPGVLACALALSMVPTKTPP